MEQANVNFQLKEIELLELNLINPQTPLKPERIYNYNINIEQRINNEEKLVFAITSVNLISEEDKQCHASIKTSCIFYIENFQDFVEEHSTAVKLPEQFIVTLNSIALSTTRGIMFTHFKGTFLHNALLPIVNPSAFVATNQNNV